MFILALAIKIKRSSGWRRRTEIGPTTWLISKCFQQTTRCVRTLDSTTCCGAWGLRREYQDDPNPYHARTSQLTLDAHRGFYRHCFRERQIYRTSFPPCLIQPLDILFAV